MCVYVLAQPPPPLSSLLSEQLVLGGTKKASKKWDQEYDAYVMPLLQEDMPSYLLYRLDSTNNQGYEWIFLAWSPDPSPVGPHFNSRPLLILRLKT